MTTDNNQPQSFGVGFKIFFCAIEGLCDPPAATPDGRPGQGVLLREGEGAEAGPRRPAASQPRPREEAGRFNTETRAAEEGDAAGTHCRWSVPQGRCSVLLRNSLK